MILILAICLVLLPMSSLSKPTEGRGSADMKDVVPLQRPITYADPITPLKFSSKAKRKPKKKHLKPKRLLAKMGDDFDPQWMAIDREDSFDEPTVGQVDQEQLDRLEYNVKALNLEKVLGENNTEVISLVEEWLVQRSSCPVTFQWTDLGVYFWPRWVKKGHCQSKSVCSWPEGGMGCVEDKMKVLNILRWHCRRANRRGKGGGHGHKCKWYKVPYPVTEKCKCACK